MSDYAPCLDVDHLLRTIDPFDLLFNYGDIQVHHEHLFRHASELNGAHGGYLEGYILLPARDCLVQLSTIPSSLSQFPIQPNVLHVTIRNKLKKKVTWKSGVSSRSWRLKIQVGPGSQAVLLHERPESQEIQRVSLENCVQGNKLILGEKGLAITVVTPLQNARKGNPEGVKIADVLKDRLVSKQYDEFPEDNTFLECDVLTKMFTDNKNGNGKIELHRLRLKADFLRLDNGEVLAPSVKSGDIFNMRDKVVGAVELHDISDPRSSCSKGGFKVLLSSEFKITSQTNMDKTDPNQVPMRAVFVLEWNGIFQMADQIYPELTQIPTSSNEFQIHQNTVAFIVPPQNETVVRSLTSRNDILKIALFRPHDGRFSKTKFEFKYYEHVEGLCPFCNIIGTTGLTSNTIPITKRAKKNVSRRRQYLNVSQSSDSGLSHSGSSSAISEAWIDDQSLSPASPAKSRRQSKEPIDSVPQIAITNHDEAFMNSISLEQQSLQLPFGMISADYIHTDSAHCPTTSTKGFTTLMRPRRSQDSDGCNDHSIKADPSFQYLLRPKRCKEQVQTIVDTLTSDFKQMQIKVDQGESAKTEAESVHVCVFSTLVLTFIFIDVLRHIF